MNSAHITVTWRIRGPDPSRQITVQQAMPG